MSTLFSYFKPINSKKTISAPPSSKQEDPCEVSTIRHESDDVPTTPKVIHKRPLPVLDSDSDEEIGGRVGVASSSTVVKRSKRRRTLDSEGDDSEEDCDVQRSKFTPQSINKSIPAKTPQRTPTSRSKRLTTSHTPMSSTPHTPMPSTPHTSLPSMPHTPKTPAMGHSRTVFVHDSLEWLKEENRRDKDGCRMTDLDYNPRTLKVPKEFLNKLTPALHQWWEIKMNHFDTILMFKVGKFYELYHMDAVVGVKELGLVFMKGEFAHSGFPELGFGKYSQSLVQKGYKVARVEQTETPAMMEKRVLQMHGATKYDKVVRREVCSVISKGTSNLGYQSRSSGEPDSVYLTAIKEEGVAYGVCFIDTSIGTFHLGQFEDDLQCSKLRTLLAHNPPAHILYERGMVSRRTTTIFSQLLSNTLKDCLSPRTEFWSSEHTLRELSDSKYFTKDDGVDWPDLIQSMIDQEDVISLKACQWSELALSALGACVWYLKRCCIEYDILSLKSFKLYKPPDEVASENCHQSETFAHQRMILDDITLMNLDVLDNCGRTTGTLLERINLAVTAFGKRLLREWVCAPLCDPAAISLRQEAVSELIQHAPLMKELQNVLKKLPDLERLLRKIHTLGSPTRSSDHPDARAILYEQTTYSKRKIADFIAVLEGFEDSLAIIDLCTPLMQSGNSQLLWKLVTVKKNGGRFPDLREELTFFQESFNQSEAKKEGVIIPSSGVNSKYDEALLEINSLNKQLEDYLNTQKKRLGCRTLVYWGSGRNRFQLEVPEKVSHHVPDEYDLKSQKKGYRRYWTPEIEALLAELNEIEEQRDAALKDTMRCLFNSFDQQFSLWQGAVECLAVLDTLISLALYSCSSPNMCRPEIVLPINSKTPFLEIIAGHHPCIVNTYQGDEYIPNDVCVSEEGRLCVVVTGPNMGGKSTLMRQTGLLVILAHLGCYVPAASCKLSPVDRIFTRLGASDRIMSGESTFFVELMETAVIMKHATHHSLVLLDELGRGTATYDGTAIAGAVLTEIAERISCRTLFSTHYHSLVDELSHSPHIRLGHMACMVEENVNDDKDECTSEIITFLYKFVEGACPKSYGFNAAQLAGLPYKVVSEARRKAVEFELSAERLKVFRKVMSGNFQKKGVASLLDKID